MSFEQEIILRHTTLRNMATAGTTSGLVIQALRWIGRRHVDDQTRAQLARLLTDADKRTLIDDAPFAPAWVAQIMHRVAGRRKGRGMQPFIQRLEGNMKSDRIKNWPKEERPREKLLAAGAEKQTDASLLAVVLRVGRGTFKKGEPGQSAQALAHTLLDDFNGLNKILGEKDITEGTPTQATVYVRRVIEEALRVSAAAVVLVHNHPSGSPEPSAGDDDTTRDVLKACQLVQLILLDHVIVGESEHYSCSDEGRLKELEIE